MNTKFKLSIADSTQLKGIALLLLLLHHLFYINDGTYDDIVILGHGVIQMVAQIAKVCVAIFVFLSGYGLATQYTSKPLILSQFYQHRFKKLFFNYWLMWILFVPMGIFYFGRTLNVVYEKHVFLKLIINITGLQDIFGFYGYNATWWFITCIILLYLVFPLLFKLSQNKLIIAIIVSFIIMFMNLHYLQSVSYYLITFIMGIWVSKYPPLFTNINICIILLLVTVLFRQFSPFMGGVKTDWLLTLILVLLFKRVSPLPEYLTKILHFLGKHSMNIFLFHTFIYAYYWHDLIYATRIPLIIYIELLVICLLISIGIEWGKRKLKMKVYRSIDIYDRRK